MTHSAEIIGMAGFNIADEILNVLEETHPGIRATVLAAVRANLTAEAAKNPTGNATAILNVVNIL